MVDRAPSVTGRNPKLSGVVARKRATAIWGHVTYTGGSSWTFDGSLKTYDDVYDFDMQWSRPMRSLLTAGAKLDHGEGKGFDIQICGSGALHTEFEK